jgi:hypothetical protein
MGVGSTNNRVGCTTKLMGAFLRVLLMMCYAFLGLWSALESVVMKKAIGRILEGFITPFRYAFCWLLVERRYGWASTAWLIGLVCQFSDWLCLDRVIDGPALQDELTWEDHMAWRCESLGFVVCEVEHVLLEGRARNVRRVWIDCRWPSL